MSSKKIFEVVGLGNALVDALVRMDERQLLNELGYTRGQMTPVSHEEWERVFSRIKGSHVEIQTGGSCANTIVALGLMGARVSYCGQVGRDEMGELYAQSLEEACGGHSLHWCETSATGKCLSIVSQADAERTMLSDLGAAVNLSELGEFSHRIGGASILHLTAYLFLGEPMASRAMEAIDLAKKAGCLVSIDAADPFVIGIVGDLLWQTIQDHADVVFLNREEATALCGGAGTEALEKLGAHCRTVVIKLGAEGSLVWHDGRIEKIGVHTADLVDTTGAGDAYAAGFLYGLVNGWPMGQSADLGSRVAALTVSQLGAVVRDAEALKGAIDASSTPTLTNRSELTSNEGPMVGG